MVLVYNFSNSNVEYSLQWMSEHIEPMGQLSSITVKVLGFPRGWGSHLPASPRACCHLPLTRKHPPALCQLSSNTPSPSGLYAPDDSSPPFIGRGVGLKGGTSPEYTSRDPHLASQPLKGHGLDEAERLLLQCKVWEHKETGLVAQTHHGQHCLGPVVEKAMLQEGSGEGIATSALQTVLRSSSGSPHKMGRTS